MKQQISLVLFGLITLCVILLIVFTACVTTADASGPGFTAGQKQNFMVNDIEFNLIYVEMKDFSGHTFHTPEELRTRDYWIGETEVTYTLWHAVYIWAVSNGYVFANPGTMGDGEGDTPSHPVTRVNWRDCAVWCNAATEWYNAQVNTNLKCAYTYENEIIRDSTDKAACENTVLDINATGFRLPLVYEWELAATYIGDLNNDGDIKDEGEYYPDDYASGAANNYEDETATMAVSWYKANSNSSTHEVKTKEPNSLGCYDMSGNVGEWCFDEGGGRRIGKLGSWKYDAEYTRWSMSGGGFYDDAFTFLGFRLAKSL